MVDIEVAHLPVDRYTNASKSRKAAWLETTKGLVRQDRVTRSRIDSWRRRVNLFG
jgi:hypothetical protein